MRTVVAFSAWVILIFMSAGTASSDSCITCHGNRQAMSAAGYPAFHMTEGEVRRQTHMPASCTDCHLGRSDGAKKEEAHTGLLSLRLAGPALKAVPRAEMPKDELELFRELRPRGENRASQLLPKKTVSGRLKDHASYNLLLWQDKNPETFAFNPAIAEKTCGRCHAGIVESFLKSPMGGTEGAHTQSQYTAWTGPSGPQSCGLWTGRLSKPEQERFLDDNIKYYNAHSTMPLREKTAHNNQKTCNKCHVGCLDCHLDPARSTPDKGGAHAFIKNPEPLSCYGGGRAFICHAGPLERRRGDGYLRAEFTQAGHQGKELLNQQPDIHMKNKILCTDCHVRNTDTAAHADFRRDVSCAPCHTNVVAAHEKGVHRKLDCAACHTSLIGGYAFNFWSAVGAAGNENPITRIQDYQVEAVKPLLVKNPKGIWIPVHVVPHTSGNIKEAEVKLSDRLIFRNPPEAGIKRRYFSNDSYAITGIVKELDNKDHDTMVWLNLDRVAHATGKSRSCEDCHGSAAQKIEVRFEGGSYKDLDDGRYTITADRSGLRITDFRGAEGDAVPPALEPLKNKWALAGDYAIPKVRKAALYKRFKTSYTKGRFRHQ